MIVDMRIYRVQPGKVAEFIKLYGTYAWPLQVKYLGTCLGWYTGLEGPINQTVQLWAYASQADRERRRTLMNEDPAWQHYLRLSAESGLLISTDNCILTPAEFFASTFGDPALAKAGGPIADIADSQK
jgi:hypothetical protein